MSSSPAPSDRDAHVAATIAVGGGYTAYRNEEDWFVIRSRAELGGQVVVDATEQMTPGLIDLSIFSVKGASAACAIPKEAALALADELRRVAS